MSDLGTIGINVEVRGKEAVRQIEADMAAVERSSKSASRSFEVFERAGLKTVQTFKYMSEESTKRLRQEEAITKELIRQRAAAEKMAAANAAKTQAQIGSNLGLGAQGISASGSASAFEQQVERLRLKYDQVYASSQLYEKSLKELNQAEMLGVLSVKQHEAALESLNAEYQAFQSGVAQAGNRFAQHVNQTSDGMNKFGVAAQQTGYQVSDFIVQVQSGTNPLVAFSQQATQLAGLLYLLPPSMQAARIGMAGFSISMATATAGLTILIPLLAMIAMNFIGSGKESDEASKKIDKQTQAYDNLIAKVEELRLSRQMEASGTQSQDEQIVINETNRLLQERAEIQDRLNSLKTAGGRAAGYAQQKQDEMELLQAQLDKNQAALDAIEYERQLETAAARRANEVRNQYREEQKFKDLAKASTEALESVMQSISTMDLSGPFRNLLGPIQAAIDKARELAANDGGMVSGPASNNINGLNNLNLPLGMVPPALGGIAPSSSQRPQGRPTDIDFGYYPDTKSGGAARRETEIRKQIDLTKELTQAEKDRLSIVRSVESSLEDGFMSMVDGTKSVTDSFKSMARDIIKELYRVLVVQHMVGGISNAFGPLTGPSTGSFGLPFGARASGGSVMGGGAYLVGENGPELVVPRHSGTVMNANQTANALGGGSGNVTVQNNITVTGSDAAMVRAEVAKMIPQITNATKAAVIDAKQRGGQMAAAFR